MISFTWIDGLQTLGFGKYRLYLQFGAISCGNFKHVRNFRVRVICPASYDFSSRSTPDSEQTQFGSSKVYNFSCVAGKAPLDLVFEESAKTYQKDFLLGVLFTMLGMGFALALEELIRASKNTSVLPQHP
jgi:hypothetical protein